VPPKTTRRPLPGLTKSTGYLAHPFDGMHGVRTSGLVAGRHLKTGHAHSRHATACYAVAPSVFHTLVRRWQRMRRAAPMEQTTFIDIGAGMGRAVLLASELPFLRVLGVEMHPALASIARRNLAAWRRAGRGVCPARIVEADATEMAFPSTPAVLFLFNPFGAMVMRQLLRAIARTYAGRPGELEILYVNHEQESVLETQPGFTRLWTGRVRRSREDESADRRILLSQPDGEYAAPAHEDCSIWRWVGTGSKGTRE
jgi:SAM-dependent methyltransferase